MKKLTLAAICSLLTLLSTAQAICGFDKLQADKAVTDPAFARMIESTNASIKRYISTQLKNNPNGKVLAGPYTIPVVVHVLHTGGAVGSTYNPTDAQIMGAINYLNQVYAGTYPGMTPQVGSSTVNDIQIQFALAQRTPTCGSTNGIDRVDASSIPNYSTYGVRYSTANGCSDTELKNFARWNVSNYYNIYVVNKIDNADGTSGQFIAGYAYFPGAGSADGTVMLATQMATGKKTLPHEIGHAFGLYHTFEGSAVAPTCPANSDCTTQGDLVCDTDPVYNNVTGGTYDFTCRTGNNPCVTPAANYNVNTESNFMAYTNCYTLFTLGQKDRIQAAMTLPSRSGLVSGSNQSLIPCGVITNFSVSAAATAESSTGTTSGCRVYRDFTYQMVLGAAATANATATLTFTGTAIAGADYDVTTNGNFASPSNTITFNSGSTTSQNFTVRIYDDGAVEPAESIIIDYTLNNNGGNASKGTQAPTLTISIPDNDVAPTGSSSSTYTVGTLKYSVAGAPLKASAQAQRVQLLYRASELTAAGVQPGDINSFALYVYSKQTTRPLNNFTIRMAQTSINYLVDNGTVTAASGLATVYTNSAYSTVAGWNNFALSTPFTWNGTSNLVFELCFNNTTADASAGSDQIGAFDNQSAATNQGNMIWADNIDCSMGYSSVSFYNSEIKAYVQIGNAGPGTAVETASGTSKTMHIPVNADEYIYSATNNKLLARLQNVSAVLSCTTAGLDEAGTTWQNYSGGQRSSKVFAITPTQNGATATYSLSLYFDNTELAGKNPSLLKIAKTSAATVAGANAGNTVLVTPTVTTLGASTTVFTANFTGFSRFFLVDASVTLPVSFVEFKGHMTSDNNALLEWKTGYEKNNQRFEVELSRDGINFTLLDHVATKGNTDLGHNYSYLHARPERGINYYRIKQIDIDGRAAYTNVINLTAIGNDNPKPYISPNPASTTARISFGKLTSAKVELEVLNAELKTVMKQTVNAGTLTHTIAISKLSAGVYFIRMTIEGKNEVIRFVKE